MFCIRPTASNPLVMVIRNSKTHVTFAKYWVNVYRGSFSPFQEQLKVAYCKIPKQTQSHTLSLEQISTANKAWGDPQTVEKDFSGIVVCRYDQPTNSFVPTFFAKPQSTQSEEQIKELYAFATNPQNSFTTCQARSLWFILDRLSVTEATEPRMQHFLSLWPGIDKWNGATNKSHYEQSTSWAETSFASFPNTMELAIACENNKQAPAPTPKPAPVVPAQCPLYVPQQPTAANPATIVISNPINYGTDITRIQPTATYLVWLTNTAATKTKAQRQICWAKPVEANHKNPGAEAFPLCSLKSSIALLFWDGNKDSPNYGQPIVKSINAHTAPVEELKDFMEHYGQYVSDQFIATTQPTQELIMTTLRNCKFCGNEFTPTRPTNEYCTPKCRIDYNAGKTFGQVEKIDRLPTNKSRAGKPVAPETPSTLRRHGIKFPDGMFYTGAQYSDTGHTHSPDFKDMPWYAKSYSPAKIEELFTLYPKVFAGCVMEELKEFD